MHPTVKPVAMISDAIKDCSRKGGLILDSFAGSGTTIMAAQATGRCARAIELDPVYVDVAVQRWQKATGQKAILAGDGRSFDELKKKGR
jgi:DNA modification methylase